MPSLNTNVDHLTPVASTVLTQLSVDWLEVVEEAAVSGNDRAIVDLAAQLPPEFKTFGTTLVDLANRFEFEQIVYLIHRGSSP